MLKVGITGGIGSGKSTVSKIFELLGVPVYNADERAKILMNTDEEIIEKIKNLLGEESYDNEGKLNRKYIASIVFNSKDKLRRLNEIVHPAVKRDFEKWVKANEGKYDYVLKEAALLFETGSYKDLDYTILVSAPEEMRINRVMKRDNVDRESVLARMRNQLDEDKKIEMADVIILNDYTFSLIRQVLQLDKIFKELASRKKDAKI